MKDSFVDVCRRVRLLLVAKYGVAAQLRRELAESVAFDRAQEAKSQIMARFRDRQGDEFRQTGLSLSGEDFDNFMARQDADYAAKLTEVYGPTEGVRRAAMLTHK